MLRFTREDLEYLSSLGFEGEELKALQKKLEQKEPLNDFESMLFTSVKMELEG